MQQNIRDKITAAAAAYGVSPALALAVAQAESGGNPAAESSAGALGVFQLMPRTATAYGVSDPLDASQNIDGGVRMLADLDRQYHGDLDSILAAYNWGSGNLASGRPMPAETTNYIARVRAFLSDSWDLAAGDAAGEGPAVAVLAADVVPDWAVQVAAGLAAVSIAWLIARAFRR